MSTKNEKNDPFEVIASTACIGTTEPESSFPYDMVKLRAYLKKTGKNLRELTYNELIQFSIGQVPVEESRIGA